MNFSIFTKLYNHLPDSNSRTTPLLQKEVPGKWKYTMFLYGKITKCKFNSCIYKIAKIQTPFEVYKLLKILSGIILESESSYKQ